MVYIPVSPHVNINIPSGDRLRFQYVLVLFASGILDFDWGSPRALDSTKWDSKTPKDEWISHKRMFLYFSLHSYENNNNCGKSKRSILRICLNMGPLSQFQFHFSFLSVSSLSLFSPLCSILWLFQLFGWHAYIHTLDGAFLLLFVRSFRCSSRSLTTKAKAWNFTHTVFSYGIGGVFFSILS